MQVYDTIDGLRTALDTVAELAERDYRRAQHDVVFAHTLQMLTPLDSPEERRLGRLYADVAQQRMFHSGYRSGVKAAVQWLGWRVDDAQRDLDPLRFLEQFAAHRAKATA